MPGAEVSFEQPKRSVKASYIEVNDKTKDFYAEGRGRQARGLYADRMANGCTRRS